MSKNDTSKIHLSSVHDYYVRLQSQANSQFTEVALQMASELKANLAAQAGVGAPNPPSTPMLELARPTFTQLRPTVDLLGRNKDLLQGVLFRKQVDQTG